MALFGSLGAGFGGGLRPLSWLVGMGGGGPGLAQAAAQGGAAMNPMNPGMGAAMGAAGQGLNLNMVPEHARAQVAQQQAWEQQLRAQGGGHVTPFVGKGWYYDASGQHVTPPWEQTGARPQMPGGINPGGMYTGGGMTPQLPWGGGGGTAYNQVIVQGPNGWWKSSPDPAAPWQGPNGESLPPGETPPGYQPGFGMSGSGVPLPGFGGQMPQPGQLFPLSGFAGFAQAGGARFPGLRY